MPLLRNLVWLFLILTAFPTLDAQEVKERLFSSGVEVRTSSLQKLTAFIESEMQKWAKVVTASGARVD